MGARVNRRSQRKSKVQKDEAKQKGKPKQTRTDKGKPEKSETTQRYNKIKSTEKQNKPAEVK